jgi:trimeric autotransporter adhesin
MNPLTQSKNTTILPLLIALMLGCFALLPQARAVCQEGCLTNENTALGDNALLNDTTGFANTAVGSDALQNNTTGNANTAIGENALGLNTSGLSNTAVGEAALFLNTTGNSNTATGLAALEFNMDGSENTAYGFFALELNRDGSNNTAVGLQALRLNAHGDNNTCLGNNALLNCKGSNNTAIGSDAGRNIKSGGNNICIHNMGVALESNTIRIGNETHTNTFIAGINGVTVAGGVGVVIDTTGHLGTATSSARYKDDIKPMDKTSEAILALKPVTFHYKHELDPEGIPQFGLVAEDVEKVNPDLVARDDKGKVYTVRYEAVNAMLLNEFLKEHRKVEEQASINEQQQATIAELKSELKSVTAALKEQASQIQKVSAQVEMSQTAPQLVNNP